MADQSNSSSPPARGPSFLARLQQPARRGVVATAGSPVFGASRTEPSGDEPLKSAPMPGVFSPRAKSPAADDERDSVQKAQAPQAPAALTAVMKEISVARADGEPGFYEQVSRQRQSSQGMKEMAAMRSLSRLLEAVYQKPGGDAPVQERIAALQYLVGEASSVAQEMVKAFGCGETPFVMAQAMDAVVALVAHSWEKDDAVMWGEMIVKAGADPLIVDAAQKMAHAVYKPVQPNGDGQQTAVERIGISLHAAYWEIYLLGDQVDGITPQVASYVTRSIAQYLQEKNKFNDLDIRTSWTQGSIKRLASLFCAQIRSLDAAPSSHDIDRALQLAKDGFEGVEFHAGQLLEIFRSGGAKPQPVDAPSR